ncbi:hypothetical protein FM038_024415 [Shewanella eurypsychrophilus]|uniref:DUF3379 domain-containing protein n=1 Tax=Shewanella eurypsychrophilus TaxID=2593656 RepID=A0ABX6VE52_9GAMM|nr:MULTISPECIES: hypothetical protein [Shewanella]QFU24955.1 hypothetical protein FS418_26045 [Shewanella sp. YLB-09]QPG60132.1 hypothetical protein FM038_024415 [Shewanella eurypsychrophilus]
MKQSDKLHASFKHSAKTFMEQESLDEEQLTRFESLLSGQEQGAVSDNGYVSEGISEPQASILPEISPNYKSWYGLSAFAASLVLVFMLSVNYLTGTADLSLKIADEVAMNHIKMKPLELKTSSMAPLRDYFTELDFSVVGSRLLSKQNNTMLGGRYCSIQGVAAAQIRYETATGQKVTLYEVGYDAQHYGDIPRIDQGELPLSIDVKGINVSLWVEKGLLMAAVQNIE